MPTGYTHVVQDGTCVDFNDFTWRCARAFGAMINQRDDDMDAGVVLDEEEASFYQETLDEHK